MKTQRRHIVFRIIRTDRDTVQKAKRPLDTPNSTGWKQAEKTV